MMIFYESTGGEFFVYHIRSSTSRLQVALPSNISPRPSHLRPPSETRNLHHFPPRKRLAEPQLESQILLLDRSSLLGKVLYPHPESLFPLRHSRHRVHRVVEAHLQVLGWIAEVR
jgi:hypothetical protein